MQISPYDPHSYHPSPDWDYDDLERRRRRKPFLRVLVLAAGAIGIMIFTFASVVAFELVTSTDAKLVAQGARDTSRAKALSFSTKAKCDRLVSEAQAVGDPLPPCAAQSKRKSDTSDGSVLEATVSLAKDALLASAAD
jgi:hypothetical protein